MALFTDEEFASYLQVDSINEDTVALLRDLVEAEIADVLGTTIPTTTQEVRLKGVALEATARAYRTPMGQSSEQIGEVATRWNGAATGVWLTPAEQARVQGIVGTKASRSIELVPTWRIRQWNEAV